MSVSQDGVGISSRGLIFSDKWGLVLTPSLLPEALESGEMVQFIDISHELSLFYLAFSLEVTKQIRHFLICCSCGQGFILCSEGLCILTNHILPQNQCSFPLIVRRCLCQLTTAGKISHPKLTVAESNGHLPHSRVYRSEAARLNNSAVSAGFSERAGDQLTVR